MKLIAQFLVYSLSLLLMSCSQQQQYQGYIEGDLTYIASNFAGNLQAIYVSKGAEVQLNETLFQLDSESENQALQEAKAKLVSAKSAQAQAAAKLNLSKITFNRDQALYQKGAIASQTRDNAYTDLLSAQAEFDQAQAGIAQAQADQAKAQWALNQKTGISPKKAEVFDTYFLKGEFVPAQHPVLALLAPEDIYLIFYVPETELFRLKLGQNIHFSYDGCNKPLKAKIRFISPKAEYTPPVIYSDEMRSKLVYRIEATPLSQHPEILHPGQPIDIMI